MASANEKPPPPDSAAPPDAVVNDAEPEKAKSGCKPSAEDLYEYDSIPVGVRLTIKQKGKLERLKDFVPRPPGAYPETHLPTWPTLPMEQKIPDVEAPKNTIVVSRGRLCDQLLRPTKCFRLDDPWHMEIPVLPPYEALHDPSAKNYIMKPVVGSCLLRQKLCNVSGQVFCGLKAFNEYRRYLNRALYIPDVNQMIQSNDAIVEKQLQQVRDIKKDVSRKSGKDFYRQQKIENARKSQIARNQAQAIKLKWKLTNELYAQEAHAHARAEDLEVRRIKGFLRDQARDEKVRALNLERTNARAALMKTISNKDKNLTKRLKEEKLRKENSKKEYLLELLDAKLEVQIQKLKNDKRVAESIQYSSQVRAEARQRKVESHRAQMPQILKNRKEKERKLWAIVRKFFNRWVDKVRARRARRPDAMHKSLWDIPTVFDATVVYLRKESGYEKLDDFIMGIVKLKRDIKAELEAEEAAEREAAERALAGAHEASPTEHPTSAATSG